MTKTTDPRAEFAGIGTEALREDLKELDHRGQLIRQDLHRASPTQRDAEASIEGAQTLARNRLDSIARDAFGHLTAQLGSQGWRQVEYAATLHTIASDSFATMMKERYAGKRPSEADLAPKRDELAALQRREKAIRAELELRKLDEMRASEEAKREVALAALEGETV